MAIKKPDIPRPGMYLLAEDIALDATMKRAVGAGSPDARFVLGGAGSEILASVVDGLTGVEVKDQRVSLAKAASAPDPVTTGPVPSRGPQDPSVVEGEPISTLALDAGPVEPTAEKPKKGEGK